MIIIKIQNGHKGRFQSLEVVVEFYYSGLEYVKSLFILSIFASYMKKSILIIIFLFSSLISAVAGDLEKDNSSTSGYIRAYFNNPVDTSVATGEKAGYLHYAIDDTLIAYINRAKYTIDVAVYNFIQSSQIADIAAAINAAFANGIRIRWIYNSSSSNSGLNQLNSNIPTLESPTSSEYGIMHHKFMVIDANSSVESDPIVWTGSTNWNSGQMNFDINNVVVLQDKNLALAYTAEFNEMWGDTGATPNLTNSKFGPYKTNNTQHIFNIGGKTVECYFSPSDNTNDYILNSINSANSEIFLGVYTFTLSEDAYAIKDKIQNQGVYVAGIIDQFSEGFSPYNILQPVMGSQLKVFNNSSSIYHNKLVIVDACDYNSDPLVETGSHNWTFSANTINDENTLIIHDSTITNMYYQSFKKDFASLGGVLDPCIFTGIVNANELAQVNVFPNPSTGILYAEQLNNNFDNIFITDLTGKTILQKSISNTGNIKLSTENISNGIYFISFSGKDKFVKKKLIIRH